MTNNKLTENLAICCYKGEALLLDQLAERRGVTRSKLIRALALDLLAGNAHSSALQEATNEKLTTSLGARVSEQELERLAALAESQGMTISRLIRRQIPRVDFLIL